MIRIDIMREVHDQLAGIDLNLALALDALLAERHVTRAATRLGITQSAASHALARLRALLGDPLLVRGPRGDMLATPRATALAPALHRALGELATALHGAPPFDPATARASVRIATSDYVELLVLPKLIERLARLAPGIDVWAVPLPDFGDTQLATGAIDVAIGPPRGSARPAGMYEKVVFAEVFRCVMRADHPLAGERLTLARYCGARHVLVAPRGQPGSFVDDALAALGRERRVAVAVPHFLVVPHLLASSDLIATLASRIAELFAPMLGLVTTAPPIELPGFKMAMSWHERSHHDPMHRWLREQLVACF